MRPHPRIRKAVKWGGTLLTLALIFLFARSCWVAVGFQGDDWLVSVRNAVFVFFDGKYARVNWANDHGWCAWQAESGVDWWFAFHHWPTWIIIPGWFVILLIAIPTALAWRTDTRAKRPGHCPTCNYDRTGLALTAYCPECGTQCPPALG